MNCFKPNCPKAAPKDTLFRVNAKGVPGIWACASHRLEPDTALDAIVECLEAKADIRRIVREEIEKGSAK